jgi:hypothetical protein
MNLGTFGLRKIPFPKLRRQGGMVRVLLISFCICSNATALEWKNGMRDPRFGDYSPGYGEGARDDYSSTVEENRDYRRGGIPTRPSRENPWISAPQPGVRLEQDNPWADAQRFRSEPYRRDLDRGSSRDRRSGSYRDRWKEDRWPRDRSAPTPPWVSDYRYQAYGGFLPLLPYGAPAPPMVPGGYGSYGFYPYWGAYPGFPGFFGYPGYPAVGSPFGPGWPGASLWH